MSALLSRTVSTDSAAPPTAVSDPQGTAAMPVSFEALGRSFSSKAGAHTVLRDVSFDIQAGEIVALLGPSGCGKSTLLRAVAGLDAPSTGTVSIDGTAVSGIDSRCAVAFQEPRLLPWKSIASNVAVGVPSGADAARRRHVVKNLLELVGLSKFAGHRPREISGGMAQRASLARALARNPAVLLLDEPFGALDALTRITMQDLLLDVHAAEPTTVLLVTHDVDEALQLADRIIVLGSDGTDTPGCTIVRTVNVPGPRPRDRASSELAGLRSSLLASLGVDGH